MLLGEDFGGRHQRRLVAGFDRMQHGQRGDHGLAAADVALQQALHRMRLAEVGGDLAPSTVLRNGEAEGQRSQQRIRELRGRRQARCAACATGEVGAAQAELLGQQFVELHAPPGRIVARFEHRLRQVGRRRMQEAYGRGEVGQVQALQQFRRQRIGEIKARQRLLDQAAQGGLAEAGRGRIHRRQALGQGFAGRHDMEARMDDLGAEVALVHLAEDAQARARLQHLLLARIKIQEAQRKRAAGIAHPRQQLAARPVGDLAGQHLDLELRGDAGTRIGQRRDARFVLVTQRQVQDEVGVALQAEPGQPGRQRVGAGGSGFNVKNTHWASCRISSAASKPGTPREGGEGGRASERS